ncbi:MAG TPA: DUF4236 domain-containing protein [Rhizomicrobium sp.]|nr:DUF4236 domain-containing protein [Rhizomicrobium sp.]
MLKGLRFQKRLKLLPGLKINLSKSGASATVGTKGAGVNIGRDGITTNAGIPGTGLSYRQKLSSKNKSAWIGVVALLAGLAFAAWKNADKIGAWLAPTEQPTIVAAAPPPAPPPPAPTAEEIAHPKAAPPTIAAQRAQLLKPGGVIYVRRAGSVLREEQKTSGKALQKLAKGAAVTVVALDGAWTQVKAGDATGWMRTSVLGPDPAE